MGWFEESLWRQPATEASEEGSRTEEEEVED